MDTNTQGKVSNFRKRHTRNEAGRTSGDLIEAAGKAGISRQRIGELSTSELRIRLERAGVQIGRYADARNLREAIERAGDWHAEHADDLVGKGECADWYDREQRCTVPGVDNGVWLYRFAAGLILSAFDGAIEDALTRPDAFTSDQRFLAAANDERYWFGSCAQLIGFDPQLLSDACLRVIDDHAEAARARGVVPIAAPASSALFGDDELVVSYSQKDKVRRPRQRPVASNNNEDLFSQAG